MMRGFGGAVSFEVGETAVGRAIGVAHDKNAFGLVETDRHADLLEDEILLEVVARGSERFGASSDDDHVGLHDALLLQKFAHGAIDAVVEAAEHGGIGDVGFGRRVEVKDFVHESDCYCRRLLGVRATLRMILRGIYQQYRLGIDYWYILIQKGKCKYMAAIAKLFRNGRSQAVRLPREFRFEGTEVFVRRDPETGDVILSPRRKTAKEFFDLLDALGPVEEFMKDRRDPRQKRKKLF